MSHYNIEELIFYGDDIKIARFPEKTRFFYAPHPLPAAGDPIKEISRALDHPLGAKPLEEQLNSKSRVTIAFDDLCLPIPAMQTDPRQLIMEEILNRLFKIGIDRDHIRLICANGLHRKWTLAELKTVLGQRVIAAMGPERIACHDATRKDRLIYLGSTESGASIEINRAVDESDMTIYVNVNFTTMNGGWKSILVGLGSWESIRHHHSPQQWNGVDSIMDPAQSPMHRMLNEMGKRVGERYNIFQVESVINNRVWPGMLGPMLAPMAERPRGPAEKAALRALFGVASLAPGFMKRFIRNRLRSGYQIVSVSAGDVNQIHPVTLKKVSAQQNLPVDRQVDILIFGVPNLSPYSVKSEFNPILLRSLVLGYMRGMYCNWPLVRENGVIIACNPGYEKFHPIHHPAYIDFWEKDLMEHMDPEYCWDRLAKSYAENPAYIDKYRNHYAYHGTHGLINWIWSGMALRRLKGVVLAGAKQPNVAHKLGFIPARNLDEAVAMARNMAGREAEIGYQMIPPLFGVVLDRKQDEEG